MGSKPRPSEIKVLFLTREYPPEVYGGAGVHVDYLTRELAKLIPVEVRTFGDQGSLREEPGRPRVPVCPGRFGGRA